MSISYSKLINDLANNLQKNKALEKIIALLKLKHNLTPIIGVEIEFYLNQKIDISQFELLVNNDLHTVYELKIKKEKGNNQFEINLPPSHDLIKYIQEISTIKDILRKAAFQLGCSVIFSPKPIQDDYGNSMHFHINFLNNNSNALLMLAARGLCHYMLDSFLVFMCSDEDYLRIDKNFMAPTHISFGGNNRTVALRIPDSHPKRLEHRLASPLTNPYLAIYTILKSILLVLHSQPESIKKINKIYGNAFDQQYKLIPFPLSPKEGFNLFKPEFFYT